MKYVLYLVSVVCIIVAAGVVGLVYWAIINSIRMAIVDYKSGREVHWFMIILVSLIGLAGLFAAAMYAYYYF